MEYPGLLLLLLLVATLTSSQAAGPASGSRRANHQLPVPATFEVTDVAAAQQQLQLDGAGVSIAVMDTGINYRHPAFGGCEQLGEGSSCRVVGGWDHMGDVEPGDLVGGLATASPNSDPMECSLNATHGTQVASVAAGDASYNKQNPWRGVAYASKLLAYKVTGGCKNRPGAVSTVATLQAIQRATEKDAAEVLNLSWGDFRTGGYPSMNYSAVLLAAMKRGALISMAAGNNGLMGPFFTEGGVAADGVLSVASVDVLVHFSEAVLQFDAKVGKNWQRIKPLDAFGPTLPASTNMLAADQLVAQAAKLKLPANIVPVSPATACSPLTTPRAVLQGQIALVKRGVCFFKDKAAAAAAAGAAAVIIYSDPASHADNPFTQMDLKELPVIPVWGLPMAETKALLAAVAPPAGGKQSGSKQPAGAGSRVRLVKATNTQPKPYTIIVKPSRFSSWGPCVTLDMLPSIAAPGSALIVATGADSFTDIEGTSYSAPFVTGALALWRQAYRGRVPAAQQAAQLAAQAGRKPATGAAAGTSSTARDADGGRVPPPGTLEVETNRQSNSLSPASASHAGTKVAQSQSPQRRPLQAAAELAAVQAHGSRSNSRSVRAQPPAAAAGGAVGGGTVAGVTLQQAAYSAFVSTAKPVEWLKVEGWAEPLARVGAGLIQVDAAILNPTVINPTHLLLRSNQVSQTLPVKITNTAPFAITYALSHLPAAAVSMVDLWFEGDQEDLLKPVAASVRFSLQGKPATKLTLAARQEVTLQVTLTAPKTLREKPYVYSGYVRLLPQARSAQQHSGLPPAQQLTPVPLVIPYQGFSQNYTTMPMLPPNDTHMYPKEIQDLEGLLHVCYANYDVRSAFDAPPAVADSATSTAPEVQDGSLGRKQVDQCQHSRAHRQEVTKLNLDEIKAGRGVVMLSVALLRPALRMFLMLYDTDECKKSAAAAAAGGLAGRRQDASIVREGGRGLLGNCRRPGAVVGGFKETVGEVWRYNTPSRDYPGSLYAYYSSSFKGNVTIRDPKTGKVTGTRPVQRGKMYRMRVYVVAPLAAADRAAGEQYKTWKFDIPGGFKFV